MKLFIIRVVIFSVVVFYSAPVIGMQREQTKKVYKSTKKDPLINRIETYIKLLTHCFDTNQSDILAKLLVEKYQEKACLHNAFNEYQKALESFEQANGYEKKQREILLAAGKKAESKIALFYNKKALELYQLKESKNALSYLEKADKVYILPQSLRDKAFLLLDNSSTAKEGLTTLEKFVQNADPEYISMDDKFILGNTYAGLGEYSSKIDIDVNKAYNYFNSIINEYETNLLEKKFETYRKSQQKIISDAYRLVANLYHKAAIKSETNTDHDVLITSYFKTSIILGSIEALEEYGHYLFLQSKYTEALSFFAQFLQKEEDECLNATFLSGIMLLYGAQGAEEELDKLVEEVNNQMESIFTRLFAQKINPFKRFIKLLNEKTCIDLIEFVDKDIIRSQNAGNFLGYMGCVLIESSLTHMQEKGSYYLKLATNSMPSHELKLFCILAHKQENNALESINDLYTCYLNFSGPLQQLALIPLQEYAYFGYFRARWYVALIKHKNNKLEKWLTELADFLPSLECLRCVYIDDYIFLSFLDEKIVTLHNLTSQWPFGKQSKRLYDFLTKQAQANSYGAMILLAQALQAHTYLHETTWIETVSIDKAILLLNKAIPHLSSIQGMLWKNYLGYISVHCFETLIDPSILQQFKCSLSDCLDYLKNGVQLNYIYSLHFVLKLFSSERLGLEDFNFLFDKKLTNVSGNQLYTKVITIAQKTLFKNYVLQAEINKQGQLKVGQDTIICLKNDIRMLISLNCTMAEYFFLQKDFTNAKKMLSRAVQLGSDKAQELLDHITNLFPNNLSGPLVLLPEFDKEIERFKKSKEELERIGFKKILFCENNKIGDILTHFQSLTLKPSAKPLVLSTLDSNNLSAQERKNQELSKTFDEVIDDLMSTDKFKFNAAVECLQKLSHQGHLMSKIELALLVLHGKLQIDFNLNAFLKEFISFGSLSTKKRNEKYNMDMVRLILLICKLKDEKEKCLKN